MRPNNCSAHTMDSQIRKVVITFLCSIGIMCTLSTGYGDSLTNSADKQCLLTIQLQSVPFREQYIAALAQEMGNMVASTSDTDSSVQSDTLDVFSFIVIKAGSDNHQSYDTIDTFSRDCLSCHDGNAASDIQFNYRNSPGNARHQKFSSGKDHPNGMDYERYVAFGKGAFKPIAAFDSKIRLINGKVGCLTCHDPLNPKKDHLVMSDFASALCRSCHNK